MVRRFVRVAVALAIACAIGSRSGPSRAYAADLGVAAEPGPALDAGAPVPSENGCGCDDLVELIFFLIRRYGVPLPTLPPPPGVPYL